MPYSVSLLYCGGACEDIVLFDSHSRKNGGALLGEVHYAEAAIYFTYYFCC